MGYTVYFPIKDFEMGTLYSDEGIAEMNKTFTRAFRRELTRLEKVTGIPLNAIRDKFWSTDDEEEGFDKEYLLYFAEDCPDGSFIEPYNFNFIKTDRKLYDIAIKKAVLAVQRKFNNPLKAWCDDGFSYNKNGITITGEGLIDKYKPARVKKITFSDMPVTYKTKGAGMVTDGSYDWNSD